MHNEHKVIRLQLQAIASHISLLLEEMSPNANEVVPYLLQRRLLTQIQAAQVCEETSPVEKGRFIVQAIMDVEGNLAGRLPTLCEALVCAGQPHIAGKIRNSKYLLLRIVLLLNLFYRVPESPEG